MADVQINVKLISDAAERGVKKLGIETKKTEKGFKRLTVAVNNSTSTFKIFAGNLAAKAVGQLSQGLVNLSKDFFNATAGLETLTTQFEVLTGSAGAANQLVSELQQFSAATPFQLQDIGKATSQLLGFGFSAEEAKAELQGIGDVASASGSSIKEIALIFGQVSAAGKLTGERLLQFQERSIPIGKALADTMKVPESAIKDLVSEGAVSFETFQTAFQSLAREGGFAFGGMEKQSRTLEGRISTLKDNFSLLSAQIGSKFAPLFKTAVSAVTQFIQRLSDSGALDRFIESIALKIPNAIRMFGGAFSVLTSIFSAGQQAINVIRAGFNSLAATAIDAAIVLNNAEIAMKSFLGIDTSGLEEQNKSLKLWKESLEEVAVESLEANIKIEKSQREMEDAIVNGTNNIVEAYKQEVVAAQDKANATVQSNNTIVQSEKDKNAALNEERKKLTEDDIKRREEALIAEEELFLAEEEARLAQDGVITEREKLKLATLAADRQKARNEELRNLARQNSLEYAADQRKTKGTAEQIKARTQLRIQETELQKKEFEKRQRDQAALFQNITTIAKLGGAEIFKVAKGFQLAQATVAGFTAIQMAASAAPFPANLPGIIAETARAATNIAGINAQSPRFQEGGIVGGNSFTGDQISARVNSGEMILNRRQQAELFDIANGAGSKAGAQEIVVNTVVQLEEEVVARAVSRQVANGFELGEQV